MNAHPQLAADRLRSSARNMTKLKAWRKAKLVKDPDSGAMRAMRITDTDRLYGIPAGTWHAWEQPPGHTAFRRPDDGNMRRLCVEITEGALSPADFYPVEEWNAEGS